MSRASPDRELDEEHRMQEDEDIQDDDEGEEGSYGRAPSPPAIDNSKAYEAFGRDTAAGRALFKIYNKNKVNYNPSVPIHTRPTDPLAEAAEKKRREAAALVKKKYNPPKLKKVEREQEVGRVPLWGGKKTTDTIDREKERDRPLYKAPSVPLAQLQHREQEKKKLQEAHIPRPKINAPLPGRGRAPASMPQATPRDSNQVLYDKIIDEIDERHQFLDSMRALGDLSHEPAIKAEIAHRLRDLKKLEAIMADTEATPAAASAGRGLR